MGQQLCAVAQCVAFAVPGSPRCSVHRDFTFIDYGGEKCATCKRALRVKTWAKRDARGLVHYPKCPLPKDVTA